MTNQPNLSATDPAESTEMLTPKELAKFAKVSISWLAKARLRGDGPPFKRFGRSIRYFPLRHQEK